MRMGDDVMDEQKRRRMTGKQPERRSLPDDDTSTAVSKRQKQEATIARLIASAQNLREHQNNTECRVDSGVANGRWVDDQHKGKSR